MFKNVALGVSLVLATLFFAGCQSPVVPTEGKRAI
jgi:hypothetical protein